MAIRNQGNLYQYGNTVRFESTFYDLDDVKVDPAIVKIVIYDFKYTVLSSTTLDATYKLDVGHYFYDYTTERKDQKLYYEWYGEVNGKPSLKRGSIITKFS